MKKFIILFRGINVGGNNLLPMKSLVPLLEECGFHEVSFYIQSGNVVLSCDSDPTELIKTLVLDKFGFTPNLFILTEETLNNALTNNPYTNIEGKFVHFYFGHNDISFNQEKVAKYLAESEVFVVQDNVFYLHAPLGIGRSKLVANIESCLGQAVTGRNLNTMNKIDKMVNNT